MYLFEKQLGRIKVSQLVPNMEEIKKLKDQEVYGKLDYLTMLRAETNMNNGFLLNDNLKTKTGVVNSSLPLIYPGYHKLEEDNNLSVQQAFANLSKVINSDVLKTVKYLDDDQIQYLALTDPRYVDVAIRGNREIKEMTGIVPVTERLYNANELVKLIGEGNLEKLYTSMPEGYFKENSELLEVKDIFAPNIWFSSIIDLYKHNIIDGNISDVYKKIEISDEILSRVRRK